jgi:hypothetical protein
MLFPQEEIDKFNTYNRKLYKTKNEEGKIVQCPAILKSKDQAIKEVESHADPQWVAKANEALDILIKNNQEFTSDQVWKLLDSWQVPRPHAPSAMGSIMRRAALAKRIKKTGRFIPSSQGTNHQRDVAVWGVV